MSHKKKELLLIQLEEIFSEFKHLKSTYRSSKYPIHHYYDKEEGARIQELYTKITSLLRRFFNQDAQYYKEVEKYTSEVSRTNLELVIGVLSAVNANFKKDYEDFDQISHISLKYEIIIEPNETVDNIYQEIFEEINGTYNCFFFNSMYILIRKVLENMVYDCLKKFYGTNQIEKYYNTSKNKHHGFGTLISNFNQLIKEPNFKANVGDIEQKLIDWLIEFQEKGNKNAHSLFSLATKDLIEEKKDIINELIKILNNIVEKL